MQKLGYFDYCGYKDGPEEEHQQPVEIDVFALLLRAARTGHSAIVPWL